jgi:NADPH-dependent 2,4-dienoyl-CoA reductase/sulfur reductase-like enzyme
MPGRVVIVGAGLAGTRCAQTLRAEGFDGALTLIGEEPDPPYERPALSKEFLTGARGDLALLPASYWVDHDIRLRLGTRVERVDVGRRIARTRHADIGWDALVVATGARPRTLPSLGGDGVHVLRTLDDARRLRAELLPGRRLVIVGAGFVGTEAASTARALGLEVTLVHRERLPFERVFGADVGRFLADRYRDHGVDLRLVRRATRLWRDGAGALRGIVLDDGTDLPCDLVLVAVGAEPGGELLGSNQAVPTDEAGRTAIAGVYACGDVAAPWHSALGGHLRLEHWTSASHQAAAAARTILGREPGKTAGPYFWSDQFGLRVQFVGVPTGSGRVLLDGDERSLEARYVADDDRLVAVLLVNRPESVPRFRRRLAAEALAA